MPRKIFYNLDEATARTEEFGIPYSRRHLQRLVEKGKLKSYRPSPRKIFVEDVALKEFLETFVPKEKKRKKIYKFYTVGEVAKILKVDPRQVWKFINEGELKTIKLGKELTRITSEQFDEFFTKRPLKQVAKKIRKKSKKKPKKKSKKKSKKKIKKKSKKENLYPFRWPGPRPKI